MPDIFVNFQVRQQANDFTASRRQAAEAARQQELNKLRGELADAWQQQHDCQLAELQEKLNAATSSLGEAHRAALEKVRFSQYDLNLVYDNMLPTCQSINEYLKL